MRSFRRIASAVVAVALALVAGSGAGARGPGPDNVEAGRVMALKFCTPCHVVLPDQELAPVFTGPPKPGDFREIVERPGTSAESLRKFLSTTHATATLPIHMANPSLTDDQTSKIIDFMLSLQTKR